MNRIRLTPSNALILGVMFVQFACAAFFIGFFTIDLTGLKSGPVSYTVIELMQIAAGFGLLLSIVLNVFLLRRILRRSEALEQGLMLARGAFHELLEREFARWDLTPAEREVALFAIKGYSNGEIASMTGKSEGTVKSQSNAVFRKSGLSGRIGLMSHFLDEMVSDAALREEGEQPGATAVQSEPSTA
jgi:DNA-binding CsgD family transcriptional regulator